MIKALTFGGAVLLLGMINIFERGYVKMFKPKKSNKQVIPKLKKIQEEEEEIEDEEEEEEEEEEEVEESLPKKSVKKIVKPKKKWKVGDMPTATTSVIINSDTNKAYDLMGAVAELLNRTEE